MPRAAQNLLYTIWTLDALHSVAGLEDFDRSAFRLVAARPLMEMLERISTRLLSRMATLFSTIDETHACPKIGGLSYYPNYIDAKGEAELVAAIDAEPWDTTWKRRRQPYGQSYGKQDEVRREIPAWAQFLVKRLHAEGISERPFDQMLVNEYFPGQGISLHKDYEPFDRTVVSLSLLSACVMDLRHETDGRRELLLLEPRSLLVLSGEARYEWQHGIASRKSDRWQGAVIRRARRMSVTFRLLKRPLAWANKRGL